MTKRKCDCRDKMRPLEGEDRVRMARLHEEITARVQEMSTIMSRLHDQPAQWTRAIITQAAPGTADDESDIEVEHIVNPDTGDSGCYDHVEQVCGPC